MAFLWSYFMCPYFLYTHVKYIEIVISARVLILWWKKFKWIDWSIILISYIVFSPQQSTSGLYLLFRYFIFFFLFTSQQYKQFCHYLHLLYNWRLEMCKATEQGQIKYKQKKKLNNTCERIVITFFYVFLSQPFNTE